MAAWRAAQEGRWERMGGGEARGDAEEGALRTGGAITGFQEGY